jgi:hypothetical protein
MTTMRPLLLFALSGCNQLFGLDETVVQMADARIDAPGCSGSQFANPQEVAGTALDNDYDPSTYGQELELWVARRTSAGDYDIWIATRNDANSAFDVGSWFVHNVPAADDGDSALSSDGLAMVFVSRRAGGSLYASRRTQIGDPWSALVPVPVQGGVNGIDLSSDGLRLYASVGDHELRMLERSAIDQAFGALGPVLATNVSWPSLSPDELELFHMTASGGGFFRRTRASTAVAFDMNETPIVANAVDPDVSSDATRLYYSVGGDIHAMTRACN